MFLYKICCKVVNTASVLSLAFFLHLHHSIGSLDLFKWPPDCSYEDGSNFSFLFSFTEDYDGALGVFTEMAYLAQERGGKISKMYS